MRWIVADAGRHQLLVVGADGGIIQRLGSGTPGQRDGPVREARFHAPSAVACTCDTLYVADTGSLRKIDLHTNRVTTLLEFRGPRFGDLELFGKRLFFIQEHSEQVGVLNLDSGAVTGLALGAGARPAALALSPLAGRLYVAQGEKVRVLKLNGTEGAETVGVEGLGALWGVAVAGDRLYVAGEGLRMLDLASGRVEALAGEGWLRPPGEPPLTAPVGLLPHGPERLLVSEPDRARLLLLDLPGRRMARLA